MKHPDKWRDTINPFDLPYKNFELQEVLGYPHAGNDVFHAKGFYKQKQVEVFIKVARQFGADIKNEIEVISRLNCELLPTVIDFGDSPTPFVVSLAKEGERLSTLLGENKDRASLEYLYEYGQTLAKLHTAKANFERVKDRKFFHIPDLTHFAEIDIDKYVYDYLTAFKPKNINECFCHGDFHYANVLQQNKHISAILDFELSGIGNREFDIAWAIILRPGQQFLNTPEEVQLFLDGYQSLENFNRDYVNYYMVLIYCYFYKIGKNNESYKQYIKSFFEKICKQ